MSTLPTRRASYQNLSHLNIGTHKPSTFALPQRQRNNIRQIEAELSKAFNATSPANINYHLSNAYRGLYRLLKERNTDS